MTDTPGVAVHKRFVELKRQRTATAAAENAAAAKAEDARLRRQATNDLALAEQRDRQDRVSAFPADGAGHRDGAHVAEHRSQGTSPPRRER